VKSEFLDQNSSNLKAEFNENKYGEEKKHQKISKNTQNIIKRIKKANRDIWTAEEVF